MRAQVASSKGNEWMISSYNAWQQRSPLGSEPTRDSSKILGLVSRMTASEIYMKSVMSNSFKVVVLILGFILIGKSR